MFVGCFCFGRFHHANVEGYQCLFMFNQVGELTMRYPDVVFLPFQLFFAQHFMKMKMWLMLWP